MQISVDIGTDDILKAASAMSLDEKLKLYDSIKDDIFEFRFKDILEKLKTDALSEEEITREVDHVRSDRYKNRC